jgi:hypothetical protein
VRTPSLADVFVAVVGGHGAEAKGIAA